MTARTNTEAEVWKTFRIFFFKNAVQKRDKNVLTGRRLTHRLDPVRKVRLGTALLGLSVETSQHSVKHCNYARVKHFTVYSGL